MEENIYNAGEIAIGIVMAVLSVVLVLWLFGGWIIEMLGDFRDTWRENFPKKGEDNNKEDSKQ